MLDNIPIFRVKKKDSDEYFERRLTRSKCYSGIYILPSNYNPRDVCEHCKIRVFKYNGTQTKLDNKWVYLCDNCYRKHNDEDEDEDE